MFQCEDMGIRISRERRKNGWSKKHFAELIGVSPSSVLYFERSKRKPSLKTFIRMCKTLDVAADYLLCLR